MSNYQSKKAKALKFNKLRWEIEAYAEDKLRDPEKYAIELNSGRHRIRNHASMIWSGIALSTAYPNSTGE